MKDNNLKKIIAQYLEGTDGFDYNTLKKELDANPDFARLFKSIHKANDANLTPDLRKVWRNIHTEIRNNRQRRITRKLLRYAAIFLLPVSVILFLYTPEHSDQRNTSATNIINSGSKKAILVLSDGRSITMDSVDRKLSVAEKGVTIAERHNGVLEYVQNSVIHEKISTNKIIVPRGGEYKLILADGSRVWLNADSELEYPVCFTGGERKVKLKGEGYFEVAHNPKHPFIVQLDEIDIRVLGTSFNINGYKDNGKIVTTLVSGRINVTDKLHLKEREMKPNEQSVWSEQGMSVSKVDVQPFISWTKGEFYFNQMKLSEIVANLQRWYDIDCHFDNDELRNLEFFGVMRRDLSANDIFRIIEKTSNVRFNIKKETVYINYADDQR